MPDSITVRIIHVRLGSATPSGCSAGCSKSWPSTWSPDVLSNRECQVLKLLGLGRINKEIADALEVDVRTVESYRRRIKEKLGVKSARELPRLAVLWTAGSTEHVSMEEELSGCRG